MKRFFSLILTIFLFIGCACGKTAPVEPVRHTDLTFSELNGSGEDAGLEIARTRELLFRIERGELNGERAQAALDARTEAYQKLNSDAALAYVRYCLDVTNEENKRRYDALSVRLDTLGALLVDAALLLSQDPAISYQYDAETVEALRRADALADPALEPLFAKERELIGRYEALSETLTVERNGTRWTGDAILNDPALPEEAFAALYEAYLQLFNERAGEIFLELVPVRNAIARELGFPSYADYRYACFDRDYTPREAEELIRIVKTEFVPLLSDMRHAFFRAAAQLYGSVFEQEPTMERIRAAIVSILPEMNEPWDYMTSHGMYDLGSDTVRMPGSFTTYFDSYGTPFLFGAWTNGFDAPPAIIHEFGHFASFYRNGNVTRRGNTLDLAEIDALGLELLTVLRYDTIYGALSDAARDAELFYALYALVDGCMEDEFQRFAYGCEDLTLERLNAEYGHLSASYGLDAFGVEARAWTQIPHTFQQPFYYISYAVGTTAALALFCIGTEDPEGAADAYRRVAARPEGATLFETLLDAGLGDPFHEERLRDTARRFKHILTDERDGGPDGTEYSR